ncbi:hypothetical protein E8E12_008943 [Didymella heteroderae]|uniref:Leucine-rich repeat domain-containing protein n=1 Tax=Didymella heteroderae TaxID=1769908 RepID=A0A9P5C213_9PLEO|nr:hypothetical protein E8E12_008943 [Didymella heteroderae]
MAPLTAPWYERDEMILPSELKLYIADYLDPQSSVKFGIACKEHWQLCQPLFKKHTQAFADAPIVTAHNALDLLRATLRDPTEGWYVREISFRDRWDDPFTTPVDDAEQLQQAAGQMRSLYPHSGTDIEHECLVTQIEQGLATGHPASAVAVLLHHLPNLRTLRLTMGYDNVFEDLLQRIGVEYIDTAKRSSLPLKYLRTVSLAHYDTEGCIPPDCALPFLRLPSIHTFAASMMGGDFTRGRFESQVPFHPHPQSGIEEFFFAGCQFDSAALEYLISCTSNLKRFTYSAGGCCTSEDAYGAKIVLKALTEHARDSLEYLVLAHFMYHEEEAVVRDFYDNEKDRPTDADLSMFTKLHSLSANWAMLWPELSLQPAITHHEGGGRSESIGLSCTPLDIRDILPVSLENLHLTGVFDREEWEGVVEPLKAVNEETPNLTKDKIRVDGRVQNKFTHKDERTLVVVGGWDDNEQKMIFGGGDKAWVKRVWATDKLFEGHGW